MIEERSMKALGNSHTAYDVMREYMIIGAELDGKYQIPMLDRYTGHPGEDTVDFKDSFSLKIKNHRKLTVNFYIHDYEFEKIWNNPDRYLEHLKCFHSVIGPDFSMAVGENGMPFAMNIWQKYRNHALSHYLSMNGIKVIPNVSIPPEYCYDWAFDGVPKRSTVACCTNGRIKSRALLQMIFVYICTQHKKTETSVTVHWTAVELQFTHSLNGLQMKDI